MPDPRVAGWFASNGIPFAIEAVRRTPSDRKGGHFARRKSDGRIVLRETAQTRPEDQAALADLDRHRFCSTNNLWFDLVAMRHELDRRGGILGLPLIRNVKRLDPADPSTPEVIQIETAMGAAIETFEDARTIEVGRDRFIPVKTTNDLLVLRSDVYDLGQDFGLDQAGDVPVRRAGPGVLPARRGLRPALPRGCALAAEGQLAQGRRRLHVRPRGPGHRRRRARVRRRRSGSRPTRCSMADPSQSLRSVDEHQQLILDSLRPLPPYDQPLLDALGLCVAADVFAPIALPSFDNSAMDGYAVVHDDVATASDDHPVHLPVVGEIGAGQARILAMSPGTAVKIMTGAPVPAGADAVVPYEWTDRGVAQVVISRAPEQGQHVRSAGEDVSEGDLLIDEGTVLGPRQLGLLASVGMASVVVRPRACAW